MYFNGLKIEFFKFKTYKYSHDVFVLPMKTDSMSAIYEREDEDKYMTCYFFDQSNAAVNVELTNYYKNNFLIKVENGVISFRNYSPSIYCSTI